MDTAIPSDAVRVAVFAHTPVLAAGLSDLLRSTSSVEVVGATTNLTELATCIVEGDAQVAVTEVLADGENPSRTFDVVRSTDRQVSRPVSLVCVVPTPAGLASDLLRRGADAVVTMTDEPEALRRAVVEAGTRPAQRFTPPQGAATAPARPALTARELDVLQGMVDGLSSRLIAEDLGVSVNTIRTHVQRLLPKLEAHNRLQAAAVAVELGLVTPSAPRPRQPLSC